jgi:DNA-binding CsgD family transcriptional regulator
LLDRELELDSIRRLISDVEGARGALVMVEGPGGIGKTSLLDAARELARGTGMTVLSGQGGVLEVDFAFGVTRQLLGPLMDKQPGPGDRAVEGATTLFDVESLQGADASSFALLDTLCAVVLAASKRSPLLLCVDDAHWADRQTLRFLAYLAGRLRHARVLVLVAMRAHEPSAPHDLLDVLATGPAATVLRPPPLSESAIASLVEAQLGDPSASAAPEFVVACAGATGGNPFLVSELIRTASVERLRPTSANAERIAGFAPAGVARAVLARLARLPIHVRRVVTALAVLGGEADWRRLAALAEVSDQEVGEAVDLLVQTEVLAPSPAPAFLHPIIREVIYDDLALSERDSTHRRAARLLAAAAPIDLDEVAAHLMSTRPRGEPWAAELLVGAARRALGQAAPEAASRYLRRALEEPPPEDGVGTALRLLGEGERRRGDPEGAATALVAALGRTDDAVARATIAQDLAQVLIAANRAPEAVPVLVEAIDSLSQSERDVGLRLEATLMVIADLDGPAGQTLRDRHPRFSARERAPRTEGERLGLAGRADEEMNRGTATEAARLALLALDDGGLLADVGPASVLFYSTAIVLLYCDRLEDAERTYSAAIAEAERSKLPAQAARGFLAGVHYRRGSLHEAEDYARQALGPPPIDATTLASMFASAFLINTLVDRGALDLATRTLVEHGADGQMPRALVINVLQNARGRLRAAQGDHERALIDHLACGQRAAESNMRTPAVANWHSAAALALGALGHAQEARDQAREGVRIATEFGSPRAVGIALLAEGKLAADAQRLEQAVDVLARSPARLEHADALVALGSHWRRAGERSRARGPLGEGLRLARTCGAETLAREAREELEMTGARPRKTFRIGVESLTASELRVARLATDGLTNQEIADRLVVSIRTVETHLAHIYQKLDITSRKQLPTAIGQAAA